MKQFISFTATVAVMALAIAGLAFAASTQPVNYQEQLNDGSGNPEQTALVMKNLTSMPLAFTENQGQWDEQVLFRAEAGGATMWFTREGTYYQFTRSIAGDEPQAGPVDPNYDRIDSEPDSIETMMIKATFVGANLEPEVHGQDMLEYKCNYFLGSDPAGWRTDVPTYQEIQFEEVYLGIALKYFGNGEQMEYDFIVEPGADYSQIRVRYDGAKGISVNGAGELVVETDWGAVTELKPFVYQVEDSKRTVITAEYELLSKNTFGFKLPEGYNPNLPLVIDPVLSYSTYLGGSGYERGDDIAVDAAGSAYVTGMTTSTDFPTASAYDPSYNGNVDFFVTKLSLGGGSLIYSTYLGGNQSDYGYGIVVDAAGSAYVTGNTSSTNFPTANAYDPTYNGGGDVFVTKLSAEGGSLVYSTYLGGSDDEHSFRIAVDAAGRAYVTGYTTSTNFPTVNAYDPSHNGSLDTYVTKLSASGGSLIYSTYLGGSGSDWSWDIAVDATGSAYVTGETASSDFPTANAYDPSFNGGNNDVFVTKLSANGSSLTYSTYLGGSSFDYGYGIAVDAAGRAYLTGSTLSSDFPTANAYAPIINGIRDVFVSRLSAGGSSLSYSTYLGGSNGDDWGYGIAVDAAGSAYVTGLTTSTDFPTANAYDPTYNSGGDVFVTKLSAGVAV